MPFKLPAEMMQGQMAQTAPTMANFDYISQVFRTGTTGWVLTFDPTVVENCKWAPGGGGGGGINWRGQWVNVNYAVNDAVKQNDGVYICQSTVIAPDNAPDLYTMRGIWPSRWLSSGVAVEDGVSIESPQFYDSMVEIGPTPQTYGNCIVYGINLTVGGTLTVNTLTPAGSPAFTAGACALYSVTDQNIGDQFNSVLFSTSVGLNQSFVQAGLSAGVYFLVVWNYFPINFPAATYFEKVSVTASGGAAMGAAPTIKWDQINRGSTQVGLTLYRGKSWDESFNTNHYTFAGSISVDWTNSSTTEVQLNNGPVTSFVFSAVPAYFDDCILKLDIVNLTGSGSLDPAVWTSTSGIAGASALPTDLGPSAGDNIVVIFYFSTRASSAGSTTPFIPLAWMNQKSGNVTFNSGAKLGAGLYLIESKTASASATLDFTATISTMFDEYMIELYNIIPASNAVDLQMLFSTDGGSTYLATNYEYATLGINNAGTNTNTNSASATSILLNSSLSSAPTFGANGSIRLFNPLDATKGHVGLYQILVQSTTAPTTRSGFIGNSGTTAVNAFRFKFSSGNIASGTIRTYGVGKG